MIRTLTEKWKRQVHSRSSYVLFGHIYLQCQQVLPCGSPASLSCPYDMWSGMAVLDNHTKRGGIRKSENKAKKDAERLAVELLRDIRDGAKALMDEYGMGEDD